MFVKYIGSSKTNDSPLVEGNIYEVASIYETEIATFYSISGIENQFYDSNLFENLSCIHGFGSKIPEIGKRYICKIKYKNNKRYSWTNVIINVSVLNDSKYIIETLNNNYLIEICNN